MNKLKFFLQNKNAREWISLMALLAVSVFSVDYRYETHILFTSLTGTEEHDAFDGTVMPIQEAPDWTSLSTAEYSMSYQELPKSKLQEIPEYRTDYLKTDPSTLSWSGNDLVIRNTLITYPVPYAGNYELDYCGEGCGSHPAVDIKVPEGTPVYGIANGVVSDAGTSSSFGKYIVIKHNGVPDPTTGQSTTLYSSYSHLSEFFVTEGQEVSKGEVIGQVGDTGTATTYHLHFQLDSADAPWHPYWPFTTAEASAAGYDFWDAVNHGVGLDNLYKYTRNPFDFVQDNLDGDAVLTNNVPITTTIESSSTTSETEEAEEEVESAVVGVNFSDLEIETPAFIMPGQNQVITLKLLNENGDLKEDGSFEGEMSVSLSDEYNAKLNRDSLTSADFDDGEAELSFYADHEAEVTVNVEIAGRKYYSSTIYIIDSVEPFAKFGVAHDGYFVVNKEETIQIQTLDLDGNPTPSFNEDGDIELSLVQGSGTFSKNTLNKKDFYTGVALVNFTADSEENVIIRVTYGTKVAESTTLESRLFNDFDSSEEFYTAVSYLVEKGTVEGYPDGTFKPDNTVSRVEALKFIFSGLDQDINDGLTVSYSDTRNDQWYSAILATATTEGVVQGYGDGSFKPTQGVNRVEFLKMVFGAIEIDIDPVVMEDPYNDVDNLAWYAPYVQYAKEKNLFPISGNYFSPGDPMSREEVAEVIYRMITVNNNDGESYNSLMRP